jgi:hypothetical protein
MEEGRFSSPSEFWLGKAGIVHPPVFGPVIYYQHPSPTDIFHPIGPISSVLAPISTYCEEVCKDVRILINS